MGCGDVFIDFLANLPAVVVQVWGARQDCRGGGAEQRLRMVLTGQEGVEAVEGPFPVILASWQSPSGGSGW